MLLYFSFNFDITWLLSAIYQIDTSYASVDKRRHNNLTDPRWSMKREHHSDARFCGAVEKKKSNQSTERQSRVTREQEVPAYYLRGLVFAAKRGKERKALRVRGREITSAVCGFSYVQEVTMVDPRAIPLRSAGPNASLFTNETMEEKQEEDEQEEKVAFVPTLSEPRRDLPLFHVSLLSFSLSPFHCLSLCFTFPISPFCHFLVPP